MNDMRTITVQAPPAAAEDEKRHAHKRALEHAGRSWHLVQIGARALHLARRHLTDSGYEFYAPQLRTMVAPPARKLSPKQRKFRHLMVREKIEPFFAGYGFVHFDARTDPWHDIFKLVGVYGIACAHNMPKPMPEELVAGLKAREVNGAIPGETPIEELPFAVGDQARASEGPFIGCRGPVEAVDSDGRISLLLTFLGSTRSVEFTFDQLEKLPTTAAITG